MSLPDALYGGYSFIPIRFAIGIRSTYKFKYTTFLKFEFHE
jgi:hypothetical protein